MLAKLRAILPVAPPAVEGMVAADAAWVAIATEISVTKNLLPNCAVAAAVATPGPTPCPSSAHVHGSTGSALLCSQSAHVVVATPTEPPLPYAQI